MLKLATILDNPGEPFANSRYRDPHELKSLGYNGIVLYETTGLSGIEDPSVVSSGEMQRWVRQQLDLVRQRVEQATKAGLDVYLAYDVLTLARDTVNAHVGAYSCLRRPGTLCPASEATLERTGKALEALLAALPGAVGVVLRFGDNDASRIPYLVGNDIYSPHCGRCSLLGRADRITLVLSHFHRLVVERLGKRLIARAWNVRPNGLHDSVELAQRVRDRLPGDEADDRFILSFKFTQTDFWRYQKWNAASLAFGKRPILYELQCQREFEGKGGIPNWQAPLWRDGCPESRDGNEPAGLSGVAGRVNFAGLWAWVRGGGWGGPFVNNESWIDANVCCVPALAEDPRADVAALAKNWINKRLGVKDPAAASALRDILTHSPGVVLKGFYIGPFARTKADPWHPNADWIQDDLVDAQAAWRIIQRLPDGVLDEVVQEKQSAVEQIDQDRAALQHALNDGNRAAIEPLLNTLQYADSLTQSLRDLLAGLIAYRRFGRSREPAASDLCRRRILSAQTNWTHHTQRHGALPGAASAFRESNFWTLTQKILAELG
ncbi:MAG: hypothetical protein K8S99_07340 [Planctomycetes bacterium]|nr:hypothetical protein [Planctomycetota bacterium]